MTPKKLDISLWRGATFILELITQLKVYTYDPAVHIGAADLKRTHQENMEFYGFTYTYVDFATDYSAATLRIMKPWTSSSQQAASPLMILDLTDGITLTAKSAIIQISADNTKGINFDDGIYELLLTNNDTTVDCLVHGTIKVSGDRN